MKFFPLLLLIALLVVVVGCRQSRQATEIPSYTLRLEMAERPVIGADTLVIFVTGPDGVPVTGAQVNAKGDMNHAGMMPVLGEATEAAPGAYHVPFEWTMGGDWVVTVTAILPDGTQISEQFDVRVRLS